MTPLEHRFRLIWACLVGLALSTALLGEQRFPPPDFESGYTMPVEHHPPARSLRLEYLDVAVLVIALALASWLMLKKRSRRGIVVLSIFSLLYFGFYREGCICAIGSVQNVALALFDSSYALPLIVLLFFGAPLATALFFGRSFCAGVCPHGALQDLVLVRPVTVPRWLEQGLGVIPFVYLGAGVVFAATGSAFIICRWDPFVPLFRLSGSFSLLALGVGFVVLGMFVGRPYCRFLCPYGALLRLASMVSQWNVRITPDTCTQCRLCENACPYGVIREPQNVSFPLPEIVRERRRFLTLVLLLPALVLGGGWLGSAFIQSRAPVHRDVALAELYLDRQTSADAAPLSVPDQLALGRANRTADSLLPAAVKKRKALTLGGWIFGGWVGLVIGLKLVGFSFWRRRNDYEPDRGGCFGCARCFLSCPQERVRLGLIAPEDAPQGPPTPANPAARSS
jgi:NosR/NirI family transcriptional regulator, nitrous oxide reductase regulator